MSVARACSVRQRSGGFDGEDRLIFKRNERDITCDDGRRYYFVMMAEKGDAAMRVGRRTTALGTTTLTS
jgi:hypothetical protein